MAINTIQHASVALKNRLKKNEGFSAKPYQRTYTSPTGKKYVDKVTIGYGNTYYQNGISVKTGDKPITQAQADDLFDYVLGIFENNVKKNYSDVPLNQNQFDALCDFAYNHGTTLVSYFLTFTKGYIRREFTAQEVYKFWIQTFISPGGVLIPDLVSRRSWEANLFLNTKFTAGTVTNTTPIISDVTYTVKDKPKPQDTYLINNEEQTLSDFAKKNGITMGLPDLLNYKDNSTSILSSYNNNQKVSNNNQATENLIGVGAKVKVPLANVESKSIYLINQTIIYNTNYNAFIEAEVKRLIDNPNYKKLNITGSDQKYGSVFRRQDALSVWIWCKSADDGNGKLIDITGYVESISTTVTKEGGNFSLTLPSMNYGRASVSIDSFGSDTNTFYLNSKKEYYYRGYVNFISKNSTHKNVNSDNLRLVADTSINDSSSTIGVSGKYWKRNKSYFETLIQNQDVIWIRFEKIEADKKRDQILNEDQVVDSKQLVGEIFDMIGLVDVCTESDTAAGAIRNVSVSGRDLSKLLIDDGTYFFPVEYIAKNSEDIIRNSTQRKSSRRLIIPSQNKDDKGNDNPYKNYNYSESGGLIPDIQFDFTRTQSIKEWVTFIFSQLANIKICPDNLFTAYKDKTLIVSSKTVDDNTGNLQYQTIPAEGIWNIVKLVLDDSICNRRVSDTSLATDTGSLMNLIMKVAQEPFCEFSMDTFGDKYYFSIRKPPFSYESFITNKCINIFEEDILSDQLSYSNEVYTWYKMNPYNSIFANDDNQSFLIMFPAVMFPEYMDIWGSKILEVSNNMLDFDHTVSDKSEVNLNNIEAQALEDMDWLIETNAYLPFTRTGSITIKSDRRIKRGMNIRNYGTGEVFYVDSVTQSRVCGDVIDGYTILNVSRGMIEEHLEKYFHIIKLRKYTEDKTKYNSGQPTTGDTWTVNKDIFDFFIHRRQVS